MIEKRFPFLWRLSEGRFIVKKHLMLLFVMILAFCLLAFVACDKGDNPSNPSSPSDNRVEKPIAKNNDYSNPIYPLVNGERKRTYQADPYIVRDDDGTYYMYCTQTEVYSPTIAFKRGPVWKSVDMQSWEYVSDVFANYVPDWGTSGAGVWAPTVVKVNDRWNYYYSLSVGSDTNPGIGVATSPTPYGPWTHYGKLLDQEMTGVRNGIDPQPFYDGDDLYIVWGSFYGIAATLLTDDGTELFYGDSVKDHITYLIDDNTDGKMNVNINYEGSYIIKRNGKLYYFGSQGTCLSGKDSTYRVRVGVCDNFLEKFATHDGITLDKEPYGEEVISPSDKVVGVGHNTVVQDFAGDYWLFYHGFYLDGENPGERIAFMDKLLWDENDMPYVEGRKASIGKDILGPTVVKHN